ncbi:MAG: LamG domain-containing protein [Planctomycetes bacterium]|nr:LamG domain-containing protein [Planctomycetota bacterium]
MTVFVALILALMVGCGNEAQDSPNESEEKSQQTDVDTDGDGLSDSRENELGTAVNVTDSDADGYSDYDEVVIKNFQPDIDNYQFNPLIADLPTASIRILTTPIISIDYQKGSSETVTIGVEQSSESTSERTTASGGSNSHAIEQSHTVGASVTVSAGIEGPSVDVTANYEYSHSTTNESTISWDRSQAQAKTEAVTNIESKDTTSSQYWTNGRIELIAELVNTGRIAWTLNDMVLAAYTLDPRSGTERNPISNLESVAGFKSQTVVPGGKYGPLTFSATDLSLDKAHDLLADPSGIVVRTPGLELLDEDGKAFAHEMTTMATRTARIIIDYGVDVPESIQNTIEDYRVAVVTDGPDGVPVRRIFDDILKIGYETGTRPWRSLDADTASPSHEGLVAVREAEMNTDTTTYWLVVHTYKSSSGARRETRTLNLTQEGYDFDDLALRPGDVLHLVRVMDADRDGLAGRSEFRYGTDPQRADTDGDGLTDLEEILGWHIKVGTSTRYVQSSPLLADSDRDGINDGDEFKKRGEGSDPTEINNNPPNKPSLTASAKGLEVTVAASVSDPDARDVIREVAIDWGDGKRDTRSLNRRSGKLDFKHSYPTLAARTVTVTCTDGEGETARGTIQARPTRPTQGLVAHFPMEGVFKWGRRSYGVQNTVPGQSTHGRLNLISSSGSREGQPRSDNVYTSGAEGNGVNLRTDGSEGGIIIADHIAFGTGGACTVGMWVRFTDSLSTRMAGQGDWLNLYYERGKFGFGLYGGEAGSETVLSDTPVQIGSWYYVVGVLEGKQLRIYVAQRAGDGSVGSFTSKSAGMSRTLANPGGCKFVIGGDVEGDWCDPDEPGSNQFYGIVDEVRVYNRALSEQEIRSLVSR